MVQIQKYPLTADGRPMDLETAVLVDATGNNGQRLLNSPVGPDGAPIDTKGLLLVDMGGNLYQLPNTYSVTRPEDYGARPNDPTFDNGPALSAASAAINAAGGGKLLLAPGATYWVGAQTSTLVGNYQFPPVTQYLIYIHNCTKLVIVDLNGAAIKCRAGLKYGSFNPDGSVFNPGMPYFGPGIAVPYYDAIRIEGNSGGVIVMNGELDGNINNLTIGGQWGDTGRQIPHNGIETVSNTGFVYVDNVYSHHHGLDGLQSSWPGIVATTVEQNHYPIMLRNSRFLYNGRQGWSIVGGVGLYATNCDFSNTGKNGAVASAPGAGVDLEAESSIVRRVRFRDCRFEDNIGVGVVADGTDVEDVEARTCAFVGTTSWGAWLIGYRFRIHECLFVGAIVNVLGSPDPHKACQFHNCRFLQGSDRSPTGVVYNQAGVAGFSPMADLGGISDENVLFNNCSFDTENHAHITLPFTNLSIFQDCYFAGRNAGSSFPRGEFRGVNKMITSGGHFIDSGSSTNYGTMYLNGVVGNYSTTIKHNAVIASSPPAANDASVSIGALVDPGVTYSAILNINEWEDVSSARSAKITFNRNGVSFAEIRAYASVGAMILYPPNTPGGGNFWFQNIDNSATNLTINNNGSVVARISHIAPTVTSQDPAAPGGMAYLRGLQGWPEVHIRPAAGQKGVLSFTHDGVADRWSVGVKTADSNLYWSAGDTALGNIKLTLTSAGNLTAVGTLAGSNLSGTNTGDQFTATTASRLLGRGSAGGAGAAQEMTVGTGLAISGTALNLSGAYTALPFTLTTGRLLGRTTAATGVVEEINIANGITLTATTLGLGALTPTSVAATGVITSSGGGVGYATGAGGTVTQLTSRTTAVTLNKLCGEITLFTTTTTAGQISTFTVNNSQVAATDRITVDQKSGLVTGPYVLLVTAKGAGTFNITVYTPNAVASDAPVIGFTVIKSVNA